VNRKLQLVIILIILILSVIVVFISNFTLEYKTNEIKQRIFNNTYNNLHKNIEFLIRSKKEATLSIALALARDKNIIDALKTDSYKSLDLEELSYTLRKFTKFKNVWFQIIDKDGKSFYRSWTKKRKDYIYKSRIDVQEILKEPKVKSSISVGKYDMTFKTMVPIYDIDKKLLGFFEIITHFNSISKKIKKANGFYSIILAHKKYKTQLTQAFTKMFINNYYVANLDANKTIMDLIKQKGVDNFISNEKYYYVDQKNRFFITVYHIPDIDNNPMGFIILFKNIDDIYMQGLEDTKKNIYFTMFITLIFIVTLGYYIFNKKYNEHLAKNLDTTKKEKDKIDAILSSQPYIIVIIYKNNSLEANDKFFEFFDKYKTLEDFKIENHCICSFFVQPKNDDGSYLQDSPDWIDKITSNPKKEFKAAMYKDDELKHFIVRASKPYIKNEKDRFTILTFVDITESKKKDDLLFEQSKNASMGEMIGNIAHQWRQPLSIISTASTGILVQKQYGKLNDESLIEACNSINDNAQYLSSTIDDFKNFIKGDSQKEKFLIKDFMDKFSNLIEPVIKINEIQLFIDIDKSIEFYGYPNELLQCFINIFNNSKDAFKQNDELYKLVFIKIYKIENELKIVFKDNAGGIDNDIITKIFEPYFTTKHQTQGTGLGLHMTYNLITSHMKGIISVKNDKFDYNLKTYKGVLFTITLPF